VGRTHLDLLAIHPELAADRHMPPERSPQWYRLATPFAGVWVAIADILDRHGFPVPKTILHHLMMIGFYQGRSQGKDRGTTEEKDS
jgi:hypothetical protein